MLLFIYSSESVIAITSTYRIFECLAILCLTMLQLSQTLIGRPVMSLRTGTAVATTISAIFNPNNLKIEGFYVQDSFDSKKKLILLCQDIREIIPQGIVINDHEVLGESDELVRLKEVLEIGFELVGMPVQTEGKSKMGKVNDYATDTSSMFVQKIYVSQSIMKSFSGGALSIDRSQIVEISSSKIIVKDLQQPLRAKLGSSISSALAS